MPIDNMGRRTTMHPIHLIDRDIAIIPVKEDHGLAWYDQASNCLKMAEKTDEVLLIRNKATAVSVYAKQAKNFDMEKRAQQIRLRAEMKLGDLMREEQEKGNIKVGNPNEKTKSNGVSNTPLKLQDMGIDKNLAKAARKWQDVPEPERKGAIEAIKISESFKQREHPAIEILKKFVLDKPKDENVKEVRLEIPTEVYCHFLAQSASRKCRLDHLLLAHLVKAAGFEPLSGLPFV